MTPSLAQFVLKCYSGATLNRLAEDGPRKSVSTERTFADESNPTRLLAMCDDLAREVEAAPATHFILALLK